MNEVKIREIVMKVFEKAKSECAVHTKNALSNHISNLTAISSKTVERLYDKYIDINGKVGKQNAHTINVLCQYLKFDSYSDYVTQNYGKEKILERKKKRKSIGLVSLIIGIGLILFLNNDKYGDQCMVWKIDHYEKADCSVSYKEKVVPLDEARLRNLKKVAVDLTTVFFDETTNEPLFWYYKSGRKIEYFTAPGLHPVNGKTLKAITEYIVNKSVPVHTFETWPL